MTRGSPTPPADPDRPPGTPRWVKLAAIVILVLVAVLVVSKLAGVEHGPGLHSGATPAPAGTAEAGAHTGPPAGISHGPRD